MKIIALILSLLLVLPLAEAEDHTLSQLFETKRGFSLRMPEDWIEIPGATLREVSAKAKEVNPEIQAQKYDYGHQRKSKDGWFAYPYMLIQIKETGRVPEAELGKLKTIQTKLDALGQEFEKGFDQAISSLEIGETVYDAEQGIVWTSLGGEVSGIGVVRSLVGTILTNKGAISFYCYAKDEDFEVQRKIFQQIVVSVRLDPQLAY